MKTLEKGEHNHSNTEVYDKTHTDDTQFFFLPPRMISFIIIY